MNSNLRIISIALMALLFVGSGVYLFYRSAPEQAMNQAVVSLNYQDLNEDTRAQIQETQNKISQAETAEEIQGLNLDLAILLLQAARETPDDSFLKAAESSAQDLPESERNYILAELSILNHNFVQAENLSQKELVINPDNQLFLATLADAQIEQGKNDAAAETLQKLSNIKPDFAALTRIAYWRELNGDRVGAIEAMEQSLDFSGLFDENRAWALTETGRLWYPLNPSVGLDYFKEAQNIDPSFALAFAYEAIDALGKSDFTNAETIAKKAYTLKPTTLNAYVLAAALNAQQKIDSAQVKIAQAQLLLQFSNDPIEKLYFANLFPDLNEDKNIQAEVTLKNLYEGRSTAFIADTVAQAFLLKGNLELAEFYTVKALETGIEDPLIWTHALAVFKATEKNQAAENLQQDLEALFPGFVNLEDYLKF
ncbi:tetratricopeptide repeat protein [bacterium]|nr:tetratricopeptide repeat protein [bacterium]NCQ55455.1 tetratricopeptide repeat protein [Candidatus Parcubacteria bacterium]NCS67817.1 tetratricopeptide repeat protein [Candidatus Peregrinibacteria bacterium]NCS96369.1 tetratricopeptide repeat protein [bacterium]